MARRINWLGALLLLLILTGVALWAYTQTPQGRVTTLMIYGSTLVRPKDIAVKGLVEQMGWSMESADMLTLRDMHRWIRTNIMYKRDSDTVIRFFDNVGLVIFTEERFQPVGETLATLTGDCDDFSILYVSLVKAAGAENARVVLGTYELDNRDYVGHAWTEVEIEGSWRVVDLTKDFEGIQPERYKPICWFTSGSWGWA